MKTLPILFAFFMLLALGMNTVAYAQGEAPPNSFEDGASLLSLTDSTFDISPSNSPIGTKITFSSDYTMITTGTDDIVFCFYFKSGDEVERIANFTALGSATGVSFSKYCGDVCPNVGVYDDFCFYAADTSAADFGDLFTQDVVVPYVTSGTGSKIVGVKYYKGSDFDGNDPTVIQLKNLTVTSARNTWIPAALFVVSLTLIGGLLFLAKRRREQ